MDEIIFNKKLNCSGKEIVSSDDKINIGWINKYKTFGKSYRVSRSVNPTRHANAKHTRVSSGPVPLYNYYMSINFINLSVMSSIVLSRNYFIRTI